MRWKAWLCTLLCALLWQSPATAAEGSLKFGLFPYVNPATLIQHHKGFIDYIEASTGLKVELVTSPDYETFLQRTRDHAFDIVLTAPHFGRVAELQSGYQRIAMTTHEVQGVYLVKADSPLQSLADLKGKTLTIAAPTSIIYRLAEQQLKNDYGLVDGQTITIIPTGTHNNAMYAALNGESDASVTGVKLYTDLLEKQGAVARKLGETPAVPGFMLMAGRQTPKRTVELLRKAALEFDQTVAGQGYVFQGYKEIDDKTMKMLDAYTTDLQ